MYFFASLIGVVELGLLQFWEEEIFVDSVEMGGDLVIPLPRADRDDL